jgi:hypothetical protein
MAHVLKKLDERISRFSVGNDTTIHELKRNSRNQMSRSRLDPLNHQPLILKKEVKYPTIRGRKFVPFDERLGLGSRSGSKNS